MVWEVGDSVVKVVCSGNEYQVAAEEMTAEKVVEIAKENGLKNFKVYINGEEVLSPEDFPTFSGGEEVSITPYDKWGC